MPACLHHCLDGGLFGVFLLGLICLFDLVLCFLCRVGRRAELRQKALIERREVGIVTDGRESADSFACDDHMGVYLSSGSHTLPF